MKLKPFLRPIFECDGRVLRKLAVNMCWRSFWGMREFAKRQKKSTIQPAHIAQALEETEFASFLPSIEEYLNRGAVRVLGDS